MDIDNIYLYGYTSDMDDDIKSLKWIGSSYKDLKAMPVTIQQRMGYSLHLAQTGDKGDNTKVLKGFGSAGVLEVIESASGGTCRAVYTVRFESVVYVLHCFQKKSVKGIATPKPDRELIKERLKIVEQIERNVQ